MTKIEWADETWNPVLGCSKISAGCANCYAIRHVHRMAGNPNPKIADATSWLTVLENGQSNWTGKIRLIENRLLDPLRWRQPRRIFVCSLSDLFNHDNPDNNIDRVFATAALCPQHTFMVLTKSPHRMMQYWSDLRRRLNLIFGIAANIDCSEVDRTWASMMSHPRPLPNVWLGVSVEQQATAEIRITNLLRTPAVVRFVSAEPLLGPLDLRRWLGNGIDWIITGGESGSGARPMHPDWARSLVQQCKASGVPIFVKQILDGGRKIPFEMWPKDLQVREFPSIHNGPLVVQCPVSRGAASYQRSKEGLR
jgi:protein gp37